jgi:ACS family hexuronate transporter-like MFS transporter
MSPSPSPKKKIKGLRWYIAGILCLATALNYLDRQTLALLATTLEKELGITTVQYSEMTAAFLASYTIMYAVSGRLVDRMGTKRGLSVFVTAWSGANALHALARTAREFTICRFFLGAAEPASFPASMRAVSAWFPMRERALAVGIFNGGTAIGYGLAAPLVAWTTLEFGWRYSFVAGGILGLVWVVFWQIFYREPRQHPRLSAEELALIEEGAVEEAPPRPVPIRQIFRLRETWGCILARMITDQLSYFFLFWIPKFLEQERGFDLRAIGRYYWIPSVALALGNVAGGAVPRWLIARGWSLDRARKTVMGLASCLIPAAFIAITRVPSPAWAITLISVAMFSHGAWANITLPAEIFPKHVVGSVTGFGGAFGSGLGAIIMLVIGRMLVSVSFTPIFLIYSMAPVAAYLLVLWLIKDLGRVRVL